MLQRTILIAENHQELREVYKEVFENLGYSCATVASSQEAKDRLSTQSFKLLILDVRLDSDGDPMDTSGLQVLDWLSDQKVETLAIVATAYQSVDVVTRAFQSKNLLGFYHKAESLERLIALVKTAMEK